MRIVTKILFNNFFILSVFLLFGCVVCGINQYDYSWDFANYHYYNPFAFFYNRMNYDIVPASVNTFFNPLPDIPLFLMIEFFNDSPQLIFAFQGIWFGLLLFGFFKLLMLFWDCTTFKGILSAFMALVIAATGQATWFQAGSSTNEIPLAFFVVCSLYIILKMLKNSDAQSGTKFFVAGLVLGLALGLKPTIVFWCVAIGLSLILCYKYWNEPIKYILLFTFAGLLGYLITNGWWMYKMWVLFDNPFFPFLNALFKSEYFDDINYSDRRFIWSFPYNLLYPFVVGKTSSEIIFGDARMGVYYFLVMCAFLRILFHPQKVVLCYKNEKIWFFLITVWVIAYVLWLQIFSIYRYIVVIEMIGALFFVKVMFSYQTKSTVKFVLYYTLLNVVCFAFVSNYTGSKWSNYRSPQDKYYVSMEKIKLPENTLVKLYNFPSAAIIPLLAKNNKFRALGYHHYNVIYMRGSDFVERGRFRQIRDDIEKNHEGPVVVFYRELLFSKYADKLNNEIKKVTKGMFCKELKNNFDGWLYVCVPDSLKYDILVEGVESD